VLSQIAQTIYNPVALQLRACRPVAECSGALWTIQHEKVGEARHRHTQMGLHTIGPQVTQGVALRAAKIDRLESAGTGVETRRQDEHIQIVQACGGLNAVCSDRTDRTLSKVDQGDVVLVENFVVTLLE